MALPSATNITTAQTIYSGTPGAGLWLISCQIPNINTAASIITFVMTVAGRTYMGSSIAYNKEAGVTTFDYPLRVVAAAGEAIVITIKSSNASDTACTSNTPVPILQAANVAQWLAATAPAMTGDAYARIGAAGAGLTAVGDTSGTAELLERVGDTDLADIKATLAKLDSIVEVIP